MPNKENVPTPIELAVGARAPGTTHATERVDRLFRLLTQEERISVMYRYCFHCGKRLGMPFGECVDCK